MILYRVVGKLTTTDFEITPKALEVKETQKGYKILSGKTLRQQIRKDELMKMSEGVTMPNLYHSIHCEVYCLEETVKEAVKMVEDKVWDEFKKRYNAVNAMLELTEKLP